MRQLLCSYWYINFITEFGFQANFCKNDMSNVAIFQKINTDRSSFFRCLSLTFINVSMELLVDVFDGVALW